MSSEGAGRVVGRDVLSTRLAAGLLGRLGCPVVTVSRPAAAEMAKLLENVFRNVNIALVNQVAQLCDRRVREGAGLDSGAEGRDDWEKARRCAAMPVRLLTRRFTVEEYDRMAQAGILSEDDRVELIEGAIVEMPAIGSRHAGCVKRLQRLFHRQVGERAVMGVQDPVRLGRYSEPQPDLALLRPRPDFYASAHPGPGDVLLLVEVSETSADADREVKVPLYARAGIPEVWLVDLEGEVIEVYRQPSAEGYRDVRQVRRGEALSVQAFPDLTLAADEILWWAG